MKNKVVDFAGMEVVTALPDCFGADRGDPVPSDLIGAEILRFGTVAEKRAVEGGGLVIDYRPRESSEERRVVLAFSELGMWVVYSGAAYHEGELADIQMPTANR